MVATALKPSARFGLLSGLLALLVGGLPNQASATLVPADLILLNGKIYTDPSGGANDSINSHLTWSQALSVRGGTILSIGTNKAVQKDRGPSTKVIDLNGRVVLPGFNDAHVHVMNGGLSLSRVNLDGVTSVFQLQEKIKTYAQANPAKKWILGMGWDHTLFPGQKYPNKEDIDIVVMDRPVMLWDTEHHAALLNSKALSQLHISSNSPNPKKGEIQKNDKGEPTGVLIEEAAFEVENKADTPSLEEYRQAFLSAQELANKFGITSIQGGPIRGEDEVKVVADLYKEKRLTVRYDMWGSIEKAQDFLALKAKYKELPEEWVKFGTLKGYVDGVMSARTAALSEPYADAPQTKGEPFYTQEKLSELVINANRNGLPVALHAIGDKAVSMAVTSIVTAKKQLFNSRLRNRVEHVELTPPFIYTKFADFNIVASVQPGHMIYEKESDNFNEARLGPVRAKNDFAWKNFILSRVHVAFGTDWPTETLNPMSGLFAAVYRQNKNGKPAAGWNSPQRITLEEAIDAYTLGSAYATREDHVKGTLREGKYADIVVLDKDPFKVKGLGLLDVHAFLTIVGGKIVYDASVPTIQSSR